MSGKGWPRPQGGRAYSASSAKEVMNVRKKLSEVLQQSGQACLDCMKKCYMNSAWTCRYGKLTRTGVWRIIRRVAPRRLCRR